MSTAAVDTAETFLAEAPAARFVKARLQGVALAGYPGVIPPDLMSGYACQEAAIALWPDDIAGWKVGRIPPSLESRLGQNRLAGPVFVRALSRAEPDGAVQFPVFEGGFAAVEAEFVVRLGADAPADKTEWTTAEAEALVGALHVGVETAGSPLATINDLGPTVVVSDFGNNAGLILGPELPDWRERALEDLVCETFVDGASVGRGNAASIPGGPIESLRFLLGHCAARGRPLKAGDLVSTGAATGIHEVRAGQSAKVVFGADATIACVAVRAGPQTY